MVKRISSTSTVFYKKVFPGLWFGFLALFVGLALSQDVDVETRWMFLAIPCAMGVFGYFMMKRLVWDLVDEVYDGGDFLLIRNRGAEHQLPLADIMNVSATMLVNPPRITLRVAESGAVGRLGSDITFSPEKPFTLNPFAKSAVAEDLIMRIDRARAKRAV